MNIDLKVLAGAIAQSNAQRQGYKGKVMDSKGAFVGYVHFMGGITKTHANAVGICSDVEGGADLLPVFTKMVGFKMPKGGTIQIVKSRKKAAQ